MTALGQVGLHLRAGIAPAVVGRAARTVAEDFAHIAAENHSGLTVPA